MSQTTVSINGEKLPPNEQQLTLWEFYEQQKPKEEQLVPYGDTTEIPKESAD